MVYHPHTQMDWHNTSTTLSMRRRPRQWLTTNTIGLTWWVCWCSVSMHPNTPQLHSCSCVLNDGNVPLWSSVWGVLTWSTSDDDAPSHFALPQTTTTTMPHTSHLGFLYTGAIPMCVQNWMARWWACGVHHSHTVKCFVMWNTGWWTTTVW